MSGWDDTIHPPKTKKIQVNRRLFSIAVSIVMRSLFAPAKNSSRWESPLSYLINRVVFGLPKRVASIATFGRYSLITIVTWLRVEVLMTVNGRLTPLTSR